MCSLSKTLAEKIRCANEKRAAVAFEPRFELSGKRTEAVVVEIVVVTDIKRGSRIRIPTDQKLPADIRPERIVISPQAWEYKARELIGRTQGKDVRIKGGFPAVVTRQPAFRVIERDPQRIDRFVFDADIRVELPAFAGIECRVIARRVRILQISD